jgi:hypothetical protein
MSYKTFDRVLVQFCGRFGSSSVCGESRKSSGGEQGGNMSRSFSLGFCLSVLACFLAVVALGVQPAWGQAGSQGSINVTVMDPSGRLVPGTTLTLQDLSTNDMRTAVTSGDGTYTFVNLSLGTYKLTVTKAAFQTQTFTEVTVHATQVTDIVASLRVGQETETVEVRENETPLVETTSNALGTNIDMKQLENLPLSGRDVSTLSFLAAGFTGTPGNGNGTWNGLPVIAQGNNIDGVISSTSRMKFSGNQQPALQARLEDIQEMTVQTDQLDVNQGYGATNMQVNFITRRGTNAYHGRVFDNYQNAGLNANSWANDASGLPKNKFIKNDFGGSIGGPILKDKLFFFGTFAMSKQPGAYTQTNNVLTTASQTGLFSFSGPGGVTQSVQLIGTPTSVAAVAGVNNTINSVYTAEQTKINSILSLGKLTNVANDPSVQLLSFQVGSPITQYFPTIRVDYNMSQSIRFNLAWNETKFNDAGQTAPWFPGAAFSNSDGANNGKAYTAAFGFDWTIKPTLVNQFRGGFLYNWDIYGAGVAPPVPGSSQNVQWNYPTYNGNMSGDLFQQPTSTYYPLFNMSDSLTWQHSAHTFNFGFSWYREQDHYWNAPSGIEFTNLGLVTGDPALNPMAAALSAAGANSAQQTEGEQLYAILAGDIGASNGYAVRTAFALNPQTKQYQTNSTAPFVLDELQKAWGLFFQDSWKIKPNFTLNYGLRWDFTGDDHDLKNAYESVGLDGVWGPSGAGNEFKPGVLTGNQDPLFVARGHQYNSWNVSPQPQIGFAWSPAFTDGFMGKLTAQGQTVVRAGFAFRKYTEPYQFFWDAATDYGAFFYQNNQLVDSLTPTSAGQFKPGSLLLGQPFPPYQNLTPNYTTTYPEAGLTFVYPYQQIFNPGIALGAFDPNIKQPYTESWNLSIQRPIGRNNAIEFRYIGSHSVHQWLNVFTDEVNIFGGNGNPGFLPQFQQAQKNLAINAANGNPNSFANNGFAGQAATPIFDAAFTGVPAGQGYGNSTFISMLQAGAAGGLATAMAGGPGGSPTYFCNIVTTFAPCAANGGYTGAGGTQPINYFQMNPLNTGQDVGLTTAAGYSNYNGLQIDFRQKQWHGMQFDANYTWSHTLGINTQNSWTGVFNQFSLRNLRQSYGPLPFDIRNSFHANGTYDLPFGSGKQFVNQTGWVDKLVGGWSVGTILTLQSGEPFQLLGVQSINGNISSTYNDFGDSGMVLNGVTTSQLQSSVSVYHVPGQTTVDLINPKYLASNGTANPAYITPNTTPGAFALNPWLYGPRYFNQDIAISKQIPINERFRVSFQTELLNVYNHPNFGPTPEGLQAASPANVNINNGSFGQAGTITTPNSPGNNGAREIEFRLNLFF